MRLILTAATALAVVAAPALAATWQPTYRAPARATRAQSVDSTVARALAAYRKVRTIRSSFEQTLVNPITGTTATARGEMQYQRPNRVSVRFTDPAGDRIVSDGKAVWVYLPSSAPGQVMRLPARAAAATLDPTNELLGKARTSYTLSDAGTATIGGRAAHAVTFVPKRESEFAKAVIWVDDADALVRQFEITDANGLVRTVRLASLAVNAKVDDSAFAFTPPAGVKIVDTTAR